MLNFFCTYFDSNYIDRGLCLWQSLHRFQQSAHLFVCCLDQRSYDVLSALNLQGVTADLLENVESRYPELSELREARSKVEYIFTLTPSWVRYVFEAHPSIDQLTYVDSDLLFFADPQPLFEEFAKKNGHVAIIAHRFTPSLQHLSIYGTYNVGWVTFKRSSEAWTCLLDWQQKCMAWCHDYVDGDRFADQKYLDAWPTQHQGVIVLDHPGANVALWNLQAGTIRRKRGRIEVYGRELIFYHFHGLSQIGRRTFFTNTRIYDTTLDSVVRHTVYGRYMAALRSQQRKLRSSGIRPLIRYKHSKDDIAFAKRNPLSGLFLYSVLGIAFP